MAIGRDGTGYSIVKHDDGSYAVQVVKPEDLPRMVTGFTTEAEADQWILEQIAAPPGYLHSIITAP